MLDEIGRKPLANTTRDSSILYSRDINALIEDVYANVETLADRGEELTPIQRDDLRLIKNILTEVVE